MLAMIPSLLVGLFLKATVIHLSHLLFFSSVIISSISAPVSLWCIIWPLLVIILPSLPTLLPFISLFLYSNSGLVLFCCVQYRAFLWLRFALATSLHKWFFVVVVFKSQMKVMFDLMLYNAWEGTPGCTLTDQYGLFCSNVSDSFIIS